MIVKVQTWSEGIIQLNIQPNPTVLIIAPPLLLGLPKINKQVQCHIFPPAPFRSTGSSLPAIPRALSEVSSRYLGSPCKMSYRHIPNWLHPPL